MPKPLHNAQYSKLLELLREARSECGLTQRQLAETLGEDQSYVSKCELGVRRLDVIELRNWTDALGLSFQAFAKRVDRALKHESGTERRLRRGGKQ
ncbi:helix-turn-helix transcriptional regulator [Pelomonas sp. SE-A7]|uniref:helix-turn-helix domain-containing protein n=1 Tax=Pelomonas sp. SE-A7 TaxID=3054953 RepID=UPI00259CFC92|nr:helix-turn-helix transcriptional regulator [Pelomonas sp. SE-A7]MDM4768308.1 helix-turn-helix transcriptional regulator [Pelomonas sp. SE-A7]